MNTINWRKWLIGVGMSLVLSLCVAGSGLVAGMKWQAFIAVFCAAAVTHLTAWMKQHPIESIDLTKTGNGIAIPITERKHDEATMA